MDLPGLGGWLALEALPVWRVLGLSAPELQRLARRRLAATLTVARRVPLFRERLERSGRESVTARDAEALLGSLPLLAKPDLQAAGNGALVGGSVRPSWRSSRSSGSTGEPLRVYYDPRSWAILKHLVKLRARAACGLRLGDRVALLDAFLPPDGEATRAAAGAAALFARRLLRLSALEPPERTAARLAEFRPDAIYGMPSALLDVASAKTAGRIMPRAIFTSGELLGPGRRTAIGRAFGCRVFDVYGTSETKEIAWECREGSLHVNADVVWLEVLGDDGGHLPTGAEGALVATSLVNRAMPLVRYLTGDRARLLEGRCACGLAFPLLGVVTGREVDHVTLPGGRRVSPYIFTCALEAVEGLLRYQVIQRAPSSFVVRARLKDPAADVAARVEAALQRALEEAVQVALEPVAQLPRGPESKFRVVVPLVADGAEAGGRKPGQAS